MTESDRRRGRGRGGEGRPDGGGDGQTLRLGIVGCGGLARERHLPVLRDVPGIAVLAVADLDARAAAEAAATFGVPRRYATAEELAADPEIDAVAVCTPPSAHVGPAIAALEAGKALFVEKPIAVALDDADRLLAHAARASLPALMGFNLRWHRLLAARAPIGAGGRAGLGPLHGLDLQRSTVAARASGVAVATRPGRRRHLRPRRAPLRSVALAARRRGGRGVRDGPIAPARRRRRRDHRSPARRRHRHRRRARRVRGHAPRDALRDRRLRRGRCAALRRIQSPNRRRVPGLDAGSVAPRSPAARRSRRRPARDSARRRLRRRLPARVGALRRSGARQGRARRDAARRPRRARHRRGRGAFARHRRAGAGRRRRRRCRGRHERRTVPRCRWWS